MKNKKNIDYSAGECLHQVRKNERRLTEDRCLH